MRLLVRFLGFLFAAGTVVFLVGVAGVAGAIWHFSKDLPDYSQLQDYEPPVMTRVHASDGALLGEYSKERRLYLPIQAVPKLVINAFLAAEDKNFYEHGGIDFTGMARAGCAVCAELRLQPPPAGRLDHHPAGREELPADQRGVVRPQDQGSLAGDAHRARLFQGPHPRTLSQRNLSRPRRLRHRGGVAGLFRQVGERTDDRGSLLSGGAAEGAGVAASGAQPRPRHRAAQLRDRPPAWKTAGSSRPTPTRRARNRSIVTNRANARAYLRRRIFRRGSPPRHLRALRRKETLRRRPVGPHHARSEDAGDGAQDHGRRPRQFRRGDRAGAARSASSTFPATGA